MLNSAKLTDEAYYPITALELYKRHTRESWEKAYGEQAPPFDPSQPPRAWVDPTAHGLPLDQVIDYNYFDYGQREFARLQMKAGRAAVPNLPGVYHYPEHMIAPTPAVVVNLVNGEEQPFNPRFLSSEADARMLLAELNGASIVQNQYSDAGPYKIEWRGEQRRMWQIRIAGQYYGAGLLLERKYKNGVGAPGKWVTLDNGQPDWIPDQVETSNKLPEVPIPCRPLADNEALYLGHPMKVVVYRTDMESPYNQPNQPAGISPDVAAMIERIDANVQQLVMASLIEG